MANYENADRVRQNMLIAYKKILSDRAPASTGKFHKAYAQYQRDVKSAIYKIDNNVGGQQLEALQTLDQCILDIQNILLKKYPLPKPVEPAAAPKRAKPAAAPKPVKRAATVEAVNPAATVEAVKPATVEAVKPATVEAVKPATVEAVKPATVEAVKPATPKPVKPATPVEVVKPAATATVDAAERNAPQNSSFNWNFLITCAAVSAATLALGIAALLLEMPTLGVVLTTLGATGAAYSAYKFFTKPSVVNLAEAPKQASAVAILV